MSTKKSSSHIFSVLLIIVFILSVTPLQVAHAAGVRYAKPVATGMGNCLSWANACTLQTALTGATSGDEIWVVAGMHKPTTGTSRTATFQLKNGVALYGGFAGTETSRDQRSPAAHVTILSGDVDNDDSQTPIITDLTTVTGNTTNSYHVVTGATGAALDGFAITAGNADGSSNCPGTGCGGGMYNDSSSPVLTNVTFTGNSAERSGGGMSNYNYSSPTLTNVTFNSNSAYWGGGGMSNYHYSSPTLTDVTFVDNSAHEGGGMSNGNNSNPMLTDVTFTNNSANSYYGGGMENSSSSPTLRNVTFTNNTAAQNGGGMYNDSSSPTLTNVTFSGNTASGFGFGSGGGMYNYNVSSPTLTNVTFTNNSAAQDGGGMYNYFLSNPTIRNTIFWGNTATSAGAQIYNNGGIYGSTPILSNSVVQDGCPTGSTCTNIITADPLLGTLGDYGGFTWTIPLLPGSSAIDTGNDAVCPATDQRGIARPQGTQCDIGAFEVVNTSPTIGLSNITTTLPENTDTSSAIKVADITITDDGIGTNVLSLSGVDAALFEIVGSELHLKAGSVLDFETNPTLNVTVEVDDNTIGSDPDDAEALAISVTNVNETPVIAEGTSINVSMSENSSPTPFSLILHATDVDAGNILTWSVSIPASHGTASASGTGTSKSIGYNPLLNYTGSDSFVVQVSDGHGGADTIIVNVTITAVGFPSYTIFLPLILH